MKKKVNRTINTKQITGSEYGALEAARDFFNAELWDGALPDCMLHYQRKGGSRGYFHQGEFRSRSGANSTDGIALNPSEFAGRKDEEILSVLVHEMAHLWRSRQEGKQTAGYHDRKWSREMYRIGLHASDTGKPGGKPNGYHMSHFIIPGGQFAAASTKLLATGWKLNWQTLPQTPAQKKKTESKTKYTCASCGLNAWAKPDAHLTCTDCAAPMTAKKAKG
jgi:predicted SprT family Zn-dependent metalloprotease